MVDDDPVALEMVKDLLTDWGFEVFTYDRGLGTTNEIKKTKADLVILDVNMPALKGDKIAEILRRENYFPDLKIIFYSTIEEKELEKIAALHGADDYLSKSADVSLLAAKVEKLLLIT